MPKTNIASNAKIQSKFHLKWWMGLLLVLVVVVLGIVIIRFSHAAEAPITLLVSSPNFNSNGFSKIPTNIPTVGDQVVLGANVAPGGPEASLASPVDAVAGVRGKVMEVCWYAKVLAQEQTLLNYQVTTGSQNIQNIVSAQYVDMESSYTNQQYNFHSEGYPLDKVTGYRKLCLTTPIITGEINGTSFFNYRLQVTKGNVAVWKITRQVLPSSFNGVINPVVVNRSKVVSAALAEVGHYEWDQQVHAYAPSGVPWCAFFVNYVFKKAGIPLNVGYAGHTAYYEQLARSVGGFHPPTSQSGYIPQPGDLIFIRDASHIGIVEYVDGATIHTIEGNTGGPYDAPPGAEAGDQVKRKTWGIFDGLIEGYGDVFGNYAPRTPVSVSTWYANDPKGSGWGLLDSVNNPKLPAPNNITRQSFVRKLNDGSYLPGFTTPAENLTVANGLGSLLQPNKLKVCWWLREYAKEGQADVILSNVRDLKISASGTAGTPITNSAFVENIAQYPADQYGFRKVCNVQNIANGVYNNVTYSAMVTKGTVWIWKVSREVELAK